MDNNSLWICLSVLLSVYNAYNAKQMEMQSKIQVAPRLNFKPQVAIRLQNTENAIVFSWFFDASRLSIKLHKAKTVKSLCEACWLSPPWTRTGILWFCEKISFHRLLPKMLTSKDVLKRWLPSSDFSKDFGSPKEFLGRSQKIYTEIWLFIKTQIISMPVYLQLVLHRYL